MIMMIHLEIFHYLMTFLSSKANCNLHISLSLTLSFIRPRSSFILRFWISWIESNWIYGRYGRDSSYALTLVRLLCLPQYGEWLLWKLPCGVMDLLTGPRYRCHQHDPMACFAGTRLDPGPNNDDHWPVISKHSPLNDVRFSLRFRV